MLVNRVLCAAGCSTFVVSDMTTCTGRYEVVVLQGEGVVIGLAGGVCFVVYSPSLASAG